VNGVVLLYHRVAEKTVDTWCMAVAPVSFAEHVEMIASRFRAGRVEDVLAGAAEVAVTFDDGYRDNLYAAKPVLERRDVPATVFVVSGCVGTGRDFWWDVLERIPGADYRALHSELQAMDAEERDAALERLLDGAPRAEGATMSAAELARLAGGVVDVGAHTVTHPDLRGLGRDAQFAEMHASKRQLEDWLGQPVTGFAYPYGGVGEGSAATARAAGFAYACTSAVGAADAHTDRFAVPRLHVESWAADELERRITCALHPG